MYQLLYTYYIYVCTKYDLELSKGSSKERVILLIHMFQLTAKPLVWF